jgi:hypothetical protein
MSKWIVIKSIEEMKTFYETILPELRVIAKNHGYALGLHGTMTRDLDLIAIPWVENYSDKEDLAKDIQKTACGFTMSEYNWEQKPHSRIATCFPICFIDHQHLKDERKSLGHIDLSVIEFNK